MEDEFLHDLYARGKLAELVPIDQRSAQDWSNIWAARAFSQQARVGWLIWLVLAQCGVIGVLLGSLLGLVR